MFVVLLAYDVRQVFTIITFLLQCHQIWMNYKAKSTGAQSHISILFMNFRSLGRLFTSFVELGDFFRIGLYSIASVLNCIQTIQMVMYNKPSRKKED